MHNWVKGLGAAIFVSAVVGCGGGGGGGASVISVPAGTKLMSLTPAQQTQICDDLYDAAVEFQRTLGSDWCQLQGILFAWDDLYVSGGPDINPTVTEAELQASCWEGVDWCNALPAPTPECGDRYATCSSDATVSDISTCLSDQDTSIAALISLPLPTCSALTKDWLIANGKHLWSSLEWTSCMALDAKCPDAWN